MFNRKWKQLKQSRFFLGIVSLAIGVSLTVCLYEGDKLRQDYSEAMGYYHEYLSKDVHSSVKAGESDKPSGSGEGSEPAVSFEELTVEDKIRTIAEREEFEDADLLIKIASCESGLIPDRRSDVKTSSATGLFQILDMHQLSEEERCDVDIATTWAINKIKGGGLNAWNASKHCWNI